MMESALKSAWKSEGRWPTKESAFRSGRIGTRQSQSGAQPGRRRFEKANILKTTEEKRGSGIAQTKAGMDPTGLTNGSSAALGKELLPKRRRELRSAETRIFVKSEGKRPSENGDVRVAARPREDETGK